MPNEEVMTTRDKQTNRYKFRSRAFMLVVATMVAGAILAWFDKAGGFAAIAAGVFTFAGLVFGADYFSKVETD